MPLPLPNLDDRRWADLVEEGRALVPRYAPRWNDHNIHDPGITLLELFAWQTECDIYGLNRTTDRHRRKFLSLIGFAPRPPQAARTMIAFTPTAGIATPFVIVEGVELEAERADGTVVPFRTLRPMTVSHVEIAAVHVDDGSGTLLELTREWKNGLPLLPFGSNPKPGSAFYIGFKSLPAQRPVTFALAWGDDDNNPAARGVASAGERARLIAEATARAALCRSIVPDIPCPGVPAPSPAVQPLPPHHSARLVWETFTGSWTPFASVALSASVAPGEVADDTRSFTLDGLVEISLPAGVVPPPFDLANIYLRCRLDRGGFDRAPVLLDVVPNAVPADQSVPLSQRFVIPASVTPSGTPPTAGSVTRARFTCDPFGDIQSLSFNPAAAGLPDVRVLAFSKAPGTPGHLTIEMVRAGVGTGLPDQQISLPSRPVLMDDYLTVHSHDGTAWQPWTLRPSMDASTRVDWHHTLDAMPAVLTFGDGERSRTITMDHQVLATAHATLGDAGNLDAGAKLRPRASARNALLLATLPSGVADALPKMTANAWPASGGADAESIAHAAGRAASVLHAHERLIDLASRKRATTFDRVARNEIVELPAPSKAVNLLDLERMTLDVPGTRIARVRAWADVHPDYPCLKAPGHVTIVIVPYLPLGQPQPRPGLLRAVKNYLDRRRPVATALHVVGPRYAVVTVTARVQSRHGANRVALAASLTRALREFLNPRTGGPDRLGWPFGRDVYRSEIMQLIDGIPGVDHVLSLSLTASGSSPQCGNLRICPTWLVVSAERHLIEVV
jgi:predicted phage baseplate assembly protein